MFDRFMNPQKNEIKAQKEIRKEEMAHIDKQQIMQAASNPAEDQVFEAQQEMRADLLKWQQDFSVDMVDLIMELKGYAPDEKGKPIKVRDEPLCNDKFIYDVIKPICGGYLNRNLINSNLDLNEINLMLRFTCNDLTDAMAEGYDVYDINFRDHNIIIRIIKTRIKPAAFRALKGWTKKTDSSVIRRIEAMNDTPNSHTPKGMFGLFKG